MTGDRSLNGLGKADIVMVEDPDTVDNDGKPLAVHIIDDIKVWGLAQDDVDFYQNFSPERRKTVTRKVDIRLVPILAILYLISHLDRANIGNAKIEGLDKDLNLTGVEWNVALSLFFVPYILLEIPSNILLKRFTRPSIYIGILVTIWGIIMTMHGFVQNFGGLVAARLFLGIFEAGFYPGAVYLCTFWYMPNQLAARISWFYCTSALSGAFSGLLAAAIAQMDGLGRYAGWRWIFIIEGLGTVILGVLCFFLLIDSPARSGRWLDPDEIRFLELQHLIKQNGRFNHKEEENRFQWRELLAVVTNWRMYLHAYLLLCISACSYGTKFTLPTIIRSMGFTSTNAQLMTAPPYVAGGLSSLFFSYLSDRFFWRMPFVATPLALITVGYSIIIAFKGDLGGSHLGPTMFAIVLTCMGIYPVQPVGSSWAANNLAPASRRAIGVAFNICVGNIGGIIGSYMYLDSEEPKYFTGFGLSLAFGATGLMAAAVLELSYRWANIQKAKLSENEIKEMYSDDQLRKMGQKSPLFTYIL